MAKFTKMDLLGDVGMHADVNMGGRKEGLCLLERCMVG